MSKDLTFLYFIVIIFLIYYIVNCFFVIRAIWLYCIEKETKRRMLERYYNCTHPCIYLSGLIRECLQETFQCCSTLGRETKETYEIVSEVLDHQLDLI